VQEVELKLIAGSAFDAAALQQRLAAVGTLVKTESFEQHDTYLDTPAAELVALGLSARVRAKKDGRQIDVKPVPIEAGLVMRRSEFSAPVSKKGDPGRTLRKLLAKMLGVALDEQASPVLSLHTDRTLHTVAIDDSKVEVCVDAVRVLSGDDAEAGTFVEVEAELVDGSEAALHRLAEAFSSFDLQGSGRSKYVRAREMVELPNYDWSAPAPAFDPSTDMAEAARAVCRQQLQLVQNYEPGTRIGLDTEHLHKMRVATRRLRTAMRVFEAAFTDADRKALGRGFRWLGRRLGAVRDLDVWVLALPSWRDRFGPEPELGWEGLAERLEARRRRARNELIDALDSSRWSELSEAADRILSNPSHTCGPLRDHMAPLLETRLSAFEAGVETFRRTHALEDAHQLRILGKRLRYTVEFLRPALTVDVKPLLKRLAAFQDNLGDLQDASGAGAFALRELEEDTEPNLAFALGSLRGASTLEAEQARARVDGALDTLDVGRLAAALRESVSVQ
jgi:triphosphatase